MQTSTTDTLTTTTTTTTAIFTPFSGKSKFIIISSVVLSVPTVANQDFVFVGGLFYWYWRDLRDQLNKISSFGKSKY